MTGTGGDAAAVTSLLAALGPDCIRGHPFCCIRCWGGGTVSVDRETTGAKALRLMGGRFYVGLPFFTFVSFRVFSW